MVDHYRVPPNRNSNDSSMVVIHDDDNNNKEKEEEDYSVFPPSNHENLYVFSNHHTPQSPPSSSSSSLSSFSTSDSDTWDLSSPFDSPVRKGVDFIEWLSMGLQIFRSKLFAVVSSFRNHRGAILSFGALVMWCWIVMKKKKKRRRRLTPNETRLMNIIEEKDGKIVQLLHQVAQMNAILINRHKALAAKVVE